MSGPINTGGPAFPTDSAAQVGNQTWHFEGMTLRDYFAAHALQGIIAKGEDEMFPVARAAEAYALADAMLKAREGGAA